MQVSPSKPVESFSASQEPSDLSPTVHVSFAPQLTTLGSLTSFIDLAHCARLSATGVGDGSDVAVVGVDSGKDLAAGCDHAVNDDLAGAVVALAVAAGAVDLNHQRQFNMNSHR
jgi:hypothetical protein